MSKLSVIILYHCFDFLVQLWITVGCNVSTRAYYFQANKNTLEALAELWRSKTNVVSYNCFIFCCSASMGPLMVIKSFIAVNKVNRVPLLLFPVTFGSDSKWEIKSPVSLFLSSHQQHCVIVIEVARAGPVLLYCSIFAACGMAGRCCYHRHRV